MADERLAAGVERIERALARIVAVAGVPDRAQTDDVEALRRRHQGLKAEVARALRELDALTRG